MTHRQNKVITQDMVGGENGLEVYNSCQKYNFTESAGYIIKPLIFSVFLHVAFIAEAITGQFMKNYLGNAFFTGYTFLYPSKDSNRHYQNTDHKN